MNSQQSQAICIQSSVKEKLSHKMAQMDIELKKVSGRQVAKKADCRRRARALPKNLVIDDSFCTQAFTEMQINKLETTKKIHMIDMKCDMVKTGKQKYQLTEKGTSSLADDTRYITRITITHLQVFRWLIELFPYRVYQSVGRMFLLTDVQNMREDLKARQEKCDKAIELLEKKKEFLQKSLKSQEDGLRELVQQRKEADQTAK